MSTHFRPRPPTATPSSPTRPSTARSTVRAVTPSPSDSFNKVFRMQFPSSPMHGKLKSESYAPVHNEDFSGSNHSKIDEEEVGRYILGANDVLGPGLQRGGLASGRSSPMKARSRSQSPKKRPYSTPTELRRRPDLSAQHRDPREELEKQGEAGGNEDAEGSVVDQEETGDWPSTPTPVSRSQRQTAYMPLGTPLRLFKQELEPDHENTRARPRQVTANASTTQQTPPFTLPQPQQSPTHLTPALPLNQPLPRKQHATNDPSRHVSVSALSNMSGGTATSKRSIFSTPGRDELERKKALVEADEGPFARAVSMQDLQQRRRRVSEGNAVAVVSGGGEGQEGKGARVKKRGCGWVVEREWCSVM
ncbi:hypothetical protein N0V83_010735 [Neocucurbitaria cava]|uniref:Uncharacterized protein n=1 Tax=Neocucurbitaria cava TaxID=798079 RepID=A0A9W8XZY4_9PLEO|nr:hypothetical protein N0V83_010735 [Neocucurbitaria cava]